MIYRDVIRKLMILDCKELPRRGGGSHWKWYHSRTGRATVLPDWGDRDLKIGTLKAAIKQLGIEWDAFFKA